jgi:glycosyltransferase involved in cell wall biosynthesis
VQRACEAISKKLRVRHNQKPFDLIHCHDWHSIPAGTEAARSLGLPLVLSLHSTEYERARGHDAQTVSEQISAWERDGAAAARLVIVPLSSTRHQLISLYGVSSDKVVIIPDVLEEPQARLPDPTEHKRTIGFNPDWPLALFAGEISHAAGADILVDALLTVCRDHHQVQLVLAGEGPLKAELERRIGHAALGHRCRFVGDLAAEAFEGVLAACDFVVIPARTWQDEGLAQKGFPVRYG